MSESLHERASRILARVIELDEKQAFALVDELCAGDKELHQEVLALYKEIQAEEGSVQQFKPNLHTRLNRAKEGSNPLGTLSTKMLKLKGVRLSVLLVILIAGIALGLIIRNQFKARVVAAEQLNFETLLNTQAFALKSWINRERNITEALASSVAIKTLSLRLDSLVALDPTYKLVGDSSNNKSLRSEFSDLRKYLELEAIGILNKDDARFMLLNEVSAEGGDNSFYDLRLAGEFYEAFSGLAPGESLYVPPLHDEFRFADLPEDLNVGTYISFASPIVIDKREVGYLINEYNVKNTFSNILDVGVRGGSSELYAYDLEGRMLSRSRYLEDLQDSHLLGYDTNRSSINNILLKNPGNNIYNNDKPAIEFENQDYTQLFLSAKKSIESQIYRGAEMTPYGDYRGVSVVGAWLWLPDYGFGLIAEENADDALLALTYFDWSLALFYLAFAGLLAFTYNLNLKVSSAEKELEDLEMLGQYRLKKTLGEGGFGKVYEGEHSFMKNPVAIKVLKKEFNGTDLLDRFKKEVKVTAALTHPNTIRVFDYGTNSNNEFYYVMEYLNGISVEQILASGKEMPVGRVVHILLHTAYSLQEAHNLSLIHRDVKPMNIMVCNQGGAYDHIKLLDFGLVKNVDASHSQQTQVDRIGGTPMFMAPERIRDPYNADQKVDIYALGATGLYALSGSYVLELMSTKMLSGQETIDGDLRSMLVKRNDVSEGLEKLLINCVHFDPDKRPVTIAEVIKELELLRKWHVWTRMDAKSWWDSYESYS